MKRTILVTGASGFVGQALCRSLLKHGYTVRAVVRTAESMPKISDPHFSLFSVGNASKSTMWEPLINNVDCIFHCIARTHQVAETAMSQLDEYRAINVLITTNLAEQAKKAGVRRFIFISSIKVNGEVTSYNSAFAVTDEANPTSAYGISKLEAEKSLLRAAIKHPMEVVIVRPVLIYGNGEKGNLARLSSLIFRGVPLPLKGIKNSRSMLHIDDLVDLLVLCVDHPGAANRVFLASDDHPISTPELISLIGNGLGKKARLFSVPIVALRLVAVLLGQLDVVQRLTGSLVADNTHTKNQLNWIPKRNLGDALPGTIEK